MTLFLTMAGRWGPEVAGVPARWGRHLEAASYRLTSAKVAPLPPFEGDRRLTLEIEDDVPLWEIIETLDALYALGFTDVAIAAAFVLRAKPHGGPHSQAAELHP